MVNDFVYFASLSVTRDTVEKTIKRCISLSEEHNMSNIRLIEATCAPVRPGPSRPDRCLRNCGVGAYVASYLRPSLKNEYNKTLSCLWKNFLGLILGTDEHSLEKLALKGQIEGKEIRGRTASRWIDRTKIISLPLQLP